MISDNDLLLYYYRDGLDAAERARIAAALGEQPELAARLHRLIARLDAAAATADVPVPEQVQQRWQSALDRAARGEMPQQVQPRAHSFTGARWRMAAAVAGALVLVAVGVRLGMQPAPDRVALEPSTAQTRTDAGANDALAYERGLRWHLANTEWQLASLETTSGDERNRLVETIIAQNRLYAIAAERANEPQLARVLRSFTPILERLADGRGDAAAEIAQLNFEMNAMQARLNAATSSESTARSLAL